MGRRRTHRVGRRGGQRVASSDATNAMKKRQSTVVRWLKARCRSCGSEHTTTGSGASIFSTVSSSLTRLASSSLIISPLRRPPFVLLPPLPPSNPSSSSHSPLHDFDPSTTLLVILTIPFYPLPSSTRNTLRLFLFDSSGNNDDDRREEMCKRIRGIRVDKPHLLPAERYKDREEGCEGGGL